jgi:hypothetical protein
MATKESTKFMDDLFRSGSPRAQQQQKSRGEDVTGMADAFLDSAFEALGGLSAVTSVLSPGSDDEVPVEVEEALDAVVEGLAELRSEVDDWLEMEGYEPTSDDVFLEALEELSDEEIEAA